MYQEKNYDEALKLLNQHKSELEPGVYHFNLGTILLKKEQFAFGRYHLELAIKNGFYTTESLKNLNSSKELLNVIQFEETNFWERTSQVLYTAPWDFYLFFTLLTLGATLLFWKKLSSKFSKIALIIIAVVPLSFPLIFINNQFAIVTQKEQPIFEGPSEVFDQSNELPIGLKVLVKDNNDGWYKIITPERFSGWVKKNSIMLIKEKI